MPTSKESEHGIEKLESLRIRPGRAGNVEILRVISWGRDRYALGAYSHFAISTDLLTSCNFMLQMEQSPNNGK
ncbi:MAG: hypothetical protein RMY34_31870 [Aulosira sp. DedQUE10]|nr:hypothetical protein [Aulosira sp. DedQUE10]